MKKKFLFFILICLFLFSACSDKSEDHITQIASHVEQALPNEFEKQFETEVFHLFTATDEEGNKLDYYICQTTFYAGDPAEVTGLHLDAISAVFDVEQAEIVREFGASGHAAAIYAMGDTHYACVTSTPEVSAVMKYFPGTLTEEEAIKTIRSIFDNPDQKA